MAGYETMIEVLYLYLLPHHFAIAKVLLILLEHSKLCLNLLPREKHAASCLIRYGVAAYDDFESSTVTDIMHACMPAEWIAEMCLKRLLCQNV